MSALEEARDLFFAARDLVAARDFPGAEQKLRQSLALVPDRPSVLTKLADVLLSLGQLDEALVRATRATELDQNNNEAWLVIARVYRARDEPELGLPILDRLLAATPDDPRLVADRGLLLSETERLQEAVTAWERALELAPDDALPNLRGELIHARMRIADWRGVHEERPAIADRARAGRPVTQPFALLAVADDPEAHLASARSIIAAQYPPRPPLWTGERYGHGRIRVAYLSPDFREHAVSYLTTGLFERHNRQRFVTYGIAVGKADASPLRRRIAGALEHFLDAQFWNDAELAAWIRKHEIDVLVDLASQTKGGRLGTLAFRPAPVQVNFLGHPGTSGAPYVDYIVADEFVIPHGAEPGYSEKVVRLPDTFQPNDDHRPRPSPADAPSRASLGLPERGFVFCSFNNTYKINPEFFDVWMRLLLGVPGSVLWLLGEDVHARLALGQAAEQRGVQRDRLVFAERMSYVGHLARYIRADLFLDTLPFNAGTTASDALWMGVPIVTCAGKSFAARMAGSLLRAARLPELVTTSLAEYEALALRLAADPAALTALRQRLAEPGTLPLFDTARYTRNIEAAYLAMWQRAEAGQPPATFSV